MKIYIFILLSFLLFLIIKSDDDYEMDSSFIFKAKCEDDKSKTDACFYPITNSKGYSEYAIFDKCGKGKLCNLGNYMCTGTIKRLKNGKSCNYDEDCLSGACVGNKCGGAGTGETCNDYSKEIYKKCGTGLTCNDRSSNNGVIKCIKVAKEGEEPKNTQCGAGLGVGENGKCQKYGTIEDGKKNEGSQYLCKSGLRHYSTKTKEEVCDTIATEPICEDGKVKTAGKWSDGTEISVGDDCKTRTDYNGKEISYYEYSKLQSKFYGEFLEEYNDLDLDEINSEDEYATSSNTDLFDGNKLKWKVYEKYLLYDNAPALQAAGIINSDGEVVEDKECEYDFILKHLDSNFLKIKSIIIAMIILLF